MNAEAKGAIPRGLELSFPYAANAAAAAAGCPLMEVHQRLRTLSLVL